MSFIDQEEDTTTALAQHPATTTTAPLAADETAQMFIPAQEANHGSEDEEGTGAVEFDGGDLFVQDEAADGTEGFGALTDLGANVTIADAGGTKKARKPRGPPKPKKELTSEEIARRQLRKPRLDNKKSKKNKTQDDETAATYFAAQQSLGAAVNLKDTVSRSLTTMMQENTLRSMGGAGEGSQQLGGAGALPALGVMNPSPFSVMLGGSQAPAGLQRQVSQGLGIGLGFGLGGAGNSQMVSPAGNATGLPLSSPLTGGGSTVSGGLSAFTRQDSNTFSNTADQQNGNGATAPNSSGLADCTERMMSLVQQRKEAAIATAMVRSATFKSGPQFPATTGVDNQKEEEAVDNRDGSEASSEEMELHVEEAAVVERPKEEKEEEVAVSRGKRNRKSEEEEEEEAERLAGKEGSGSQEPQEEQGEGLTKEEKAALQRYEAGSDDDEDENDAPPKPVKSGKYPSSAAGKTGTAPQIQKVDTTAAAVEPSAEEEAAIKREEELRDQHLDALRRRHEIERLQKHYVLEQVKKTATQSQDDTTLLSSGGVSVAGVSPDMVMGDSSNFASPTVMGAPGFSVKSQPQQLNNSNAKGGGGAGSSLLAATRRRDLLSKRTGSAFSKVSSDQVEALTRSNTFDKASAGPVVFSKKK